MQSLLGLVQQASWAVLLATGTHPTSFRCGLTRKEPPGTQTRGPATEGLVGPGGYANDWHKLAWQVAPAGGT